jgi:hypothetical protein
MLEKLSKETETSRDRVESFWCQVFQLIAYRIVFPKKSVKRLIERYSDDLLTILQQKINIQGCKAKLQSIKVRTSDSNGDCIGGKKDLLIQLKFVCEEDVDQISALFAKLLENSKIKAMTKKI